MLFKDVLGHQHIKKHLKQSVANNRIAHAQLFVGNEGVGTLPMAIAYAQFLLCENANNKDACDLKCEKLAHPDLHFSFPVTTNTAVKKDPISNLFIEDWRLFIAQNPYGNLYQWLQHIGVENKQGIINKFEAQQIVKTLKLKSFEGGFKVQIIWMAEKMNTEAANKLLKLIEEPPSKTVFILIAEHEDQILQTIRSRCQVLHFQNLSEKDITEALITQEGLADLEAKNIAVQSQGNYAKALRLVEDNASDSLFEEWFINWIRSAFRARGNAAVIQDLVNWSNTIAVTGRETQKQFLQYCIQFFRQALLYNYKAHNLVHFNSRTGFDLSKFAPFVHSQNILEITKELEDAIYHIERNGNAKIILTDLSIKLTRFLHIKEAV